ncbi:MAG: efflux RND transporter periplasmic adaptor subunit [Microscillaceae bacterium]|nr:efflux RND transporter periplasmic adaptor subunit [Microscillaceae bacterium]MDW8460178.1 efflux RND transporter periplasmic adaptor subunit [Cytophagales bacterium]
MYQKILRFSVLVFLLFTACQTKQTSVQPHYRKIIEAVYASGKIYPKNRQVVASKVVGYVTNIFVKVGQEVDINTPILQIANKTNEKNIQISENTAKLAQKNARLDQATLQALRNDVENARIKLQNDSVNYFRLLNLYQQNATTANQLDQAKTQYEIAKRNYEKAQNLLNSSREDLENRSLNALLSWQALVANQEDFNIKAEQKGKIYNIFPKKGELVFQNALLYEIGDVQNFEAEVMVDEDDIYKIQLGQAVLLKADAIPQFLNGTVKEIYPTVSTASKTVKVLVDLNINSSELLNKILSGISVEANIIIKNVEKALVIPKIYLKKEGDKAYVQLKNQPRRKEVKIGVEDLEFVQIVSGLSEQDELVLPDKR